MYTAVIRHWGCLQITQQMGDVDVISVVIHLVAANRIEEVMEVRPVTFLDVSQCLKLVFAWMA